MPLILKPLKKECEKIEFGKVELVIPGGIPFELMVEFYDLKNMDSKNLTTKDLKNIGRLTKKILCLKNSKEKVDKFISDLETEELIEVVVYITNFLASVKGKKKDSKADLKDS